MFKSSTGVLAIFVSGMVGLGCGSQSSLKPGKGAPDGAATGGHDSGGASGRTGGTIGSGGVVAGASGGSGGSTGTTGGGATGGVVAGGAGGTGPCFALPCVPLLCPSGYLEEDSDPCGCPRCVPAPDAGIAKDASQDAPICMPHPCIVVGPCPGGYQPSPEPCGCPICAPVDAGPIADAGKSADVAPVCVGRTCPALKCQYGDIPRPGDLCGCRTCASPPDSGGEPVCAGLDECTCGATPGCAGIAGTCYCPFPKCNPLGACICGGGRFVGCAPQAIATCAGAKTRVAALCPNLKGATFDAVCNQPSPECVTKCLAEVNSCSDVSCSFCDVCDCMGDRFSVCYGQCTALTGP